MKSNKICKNMPSRTKGNFWVKDKKYFFFFAKNLIIIYKLRKNLKNNYERTNK